MDVKIITLPTDRITDWDTFHEVFKNLLGFPEFYGRNMNAWNDCMISLDNADHGMSSITVARGGLVILQLEKEKDFKNRCPEQYETLIECSSFVNHARVAAGELPVLALLLIGSLYDPERERQEFKNGLADISAALRSRFGGEKFE